MMRSHFHPARLLRALIAFAAMVAAGAAQAQIRVEFELPRRLYLVYEPILATVTVTNFTGQDLLLHDDGAQKWFGFEITTPEGRIVPPTEADYKVPPLQVAAGQAVRRQINLTPLYRLGEFGTYKVRANIWCSDLNRYFASAPKQFDITDGKLIWQQTVGVPGGGGTRVYSLLTHRRERDTRLYVRVENREEGVVYATAQIGRTLSFSPPQTELDSANALHVLQMVAPKTYLYTQIDTDGQLQARETYVGTRENNPSLRRSDTGSVIVRGGNIALDQDQQAGASPPPEVPRISDRPVPMPSPGKPGRD
jgi:hypothetical protein